MVTTLVFGPQTRRFSKILSDGGNANDDQKMAMDAIRSDYLNECQRAWTNAMTALYGAGDNMSAMMVTEFLMMASECYPPAVVEAALAVGAEHLIGTEFTAEDYGTMTSAWSQVMGREFLNS